MHKALNLRNDVDWLYVSKKKGEEEDLPALKKALTYQYNTRLRRKTRRKTDYSHQKQYWWHEDQLNEFNQKKIWKINPTLWMFKATNKQHLTRENVNMAKKDKH